jgi:MipA family protein
MYPYLRYHCRVFLAMMLCLSYNFPANAEPKQLIPSADLKPLWEMRLATFGRYGPAYPGSEDSQLNIVPLPLPIYRGKVLRIGENSESPIRGRIFRGDRIKLDFAFDLNFPVDSEDIEVRKNMPDLDLLIEIGPELEFQFTKEPKLGGHWYLGLQLRPAFSFDGLDPSYRGIAFSPEFSYRINFADERDSLKLRVTPTWATEKYMGYFYNVDSSLATLERDAYQARSGYLGTDLSLSWVKTINERWEFVTGTRLSLNQGAKNEESPLYTKDYGIAVFAAFTWKFWESSTREAATNN